MPAELNQPAAAAAGSVYLGNSQGWLARFDLADALRSDTVETVAAFRAQGLRVILLSGDQPEV
ncbi:hypothetical protein ABTE74_23040, partial [Acinetobacter baumannii]